MSREPWRLRRDDLFGLLMRRYVCFRHGEQGFAAFYASFGTERPRDTFEVDFARDMCIKDAMHVRALFFYDMIETNDMPEPDCYVVVRHGLDGYSYYSGSMGSVEFSGFEEATTYGSRADALCRKYTLSYLDKDSLYRIIPLWKYARLVSPCENRYVCEDGGRCDNAVCTF